MRDYFELTKPSMVAANLLVAAASFIFGSGGQIQWATFGYLILGLTLVVASACVFNNIYDREIDLKMLRTKSRTMAAGRVIKSHAIIFGLVLIALGAALLWQTNLLALGAGLAGFGVYVLLYTPLKHYSGHALWVGALAGAMPPVAGYVAASGTLDLWALVLFILMFVWQLPHFLAIAKYRYEEYAAADVPMLVSPPQSEAGRTRARKVFFDSLIVLLAACAVLVLAPYV